MYYILTSSVYLAMISAEKPKCSFVCPKPESYKQIVWSVNSSPRASWRLSMYVWLHLVFKYVHDN